MAASKNLISRCIDHYENLSTFEVRVLLEWLLHHWTCDQRRAFSMEFPTISEKLNPGTLQNSEAGNALRALLDNPPESH